MTRNTSCRLPDNLYTALKEEADQRGWSISQVMKEALMQWHRRRQDAIESVQKGKNLAHIFRGPPRQSERHGKRTY